MARTRPATSGDASGIAGGRRQANPATRTRNDPTQKIRVSRCARSAAGSARRSRRPAGRSRDTPSFSDLGKWRFLSSTQQMGSLTEMDLAMSDRLIGSFRRIGCNGGVEAHGHPLSRVCRTSCAGG